MNAPIAVVIPWGGHQRDWLAEQVTAVLASLDAAPTVESADVVIACNASGTVAVADQALAEVRHVARSRIVVIDASAVAGPAYARNSGVVATNAKKILFCDADDVVTEPWASAMLDALDEFDIARGGLDHSMNRFGTPFDPTVTTPPRPILDHLGYGPMSNLAVSRHAFELAGGISEDLRIGEDVDFCWRAQYRGATFAYVPVAVVRLRWRSTLRGHFMQAYQWGRGDVALWHRHRQHGARRPNPQQLLRQFVRGAVNAVMGISSGTKRWAGAHQMGKALGVTVELLVSHRKTAQTRNMTTSKQTRAPLPPPSEGK